MQQFRPGPSLGCIYRLSPPLSLRGDMGGGGLEGVPQLVQLTTLRCRPQHPAAVLADRNAVGIQVAEDQIEDGIAHAQQARGDRGGGNGGVGIAVDIDVV